MTLSHVDTRCRRRPNRLRFCPALQILERRDLLAAVPFGAGPRDTAEFMLGDVLVSVVLMESNGAIDANTEDWKTDQIRDVKQRVTEGLQWWEELLASKNTVHDLTFHYDFTYLEHPVETGYEPISRVSNDFTLWIDDFFVEADVSEAGSFSDRIYEFNHAQRLAHQTNWAFTIFVVNADNDQDGRFDADGSFSQSFAYSGGRFFVTTSERPPSTIAHEAAHMFWAMDEYPGGKTYADRRGYYNTQNVNAADGNPNPDARVRSIMDSTEISYALDAVSPSTLEMIGWKDSDTDGIFDVLDVPNLLVGDTEFDPVTREFRLDGFTQVQTLPNLNPSGTGNSMTLNVIDRVEIRFDESTWQTLAEIGAYRADLNLSVSVPPGVSRIEVRAVDAQATVSSNVLMEEFASGPIGWQNVTNPLDVNADGVVSPLDALVVINQINQGGPRPLEPVFNSPDVLGGSAGESLSSSLKPHFFVDVNGDEFLSPLDVLLVINYLNATDPQSSSGMSSSDSAEGEGPRAALAVELDPPSCAAAVRPSSAWRHPTSEPRPEATRQEVSFLSPTKKVTSWLPNRPIEPSQANLRRVACQVVLVDAVMEEWDDGLSTLGTSPLERVAELVDVAAGMGTESAT